MKSRACCAALLLATLVGCASDEEQSADPSGSASSASSTTTTPTADPSPSNPPAAGKLVDTEVVTFRLPEGDWEVGETRAMLFDDDGYWGIGMIHGPTYGINLEEAAAERLHFRRTGADLKLKRMPNRVVDGLDGFVLEGVDAEGEGLYYEYGVVSGKNTVFLEFEFPAPTTKARAWIDAVLASVEWK